MLVINPANGTPIATLQEDDKDSIIQKFAILQKGQKDWAAIPVSERVAAIKRFYDLLALEKDTLAATLTDEVGKPLQQSYNEINGARNRIRFFIEQSEKILAEEWTSTIGGTHEKITYEPLGVIANISAWNYPYLVGTNVFIPALIGGNAVFYKPSEYATLTGLHIQSLLYKAGIPTNVFDIAIGDGNTGETLLDLPFDGYFFTGSHATGKYIASKVSHKLVPIQLELGGKDTLYITDDVVDINQVAIATADGVFYNNGQSCCSVERLYVHENIYESFLTSFVNEVRSWKIGLPTQKDVYIGALTRPAQIDLLQSQIDEAISKGASVITGGKRINRPGNYFEPTVVVNVTNDMTIMQEESFGPIVGIMKVHSDEEAVTLMNDTKYGLTAGVYSSNQQRAEIILQQLNTGSVYWNCCDRVSPSLPWSGRKHSGLGSTLSHIGIKAFVQPKAWHLRF